MASPRSALFVIDIQNDLAGNPETQIPHTDRIRSSADKVIACARRLNDSARAKQSPVPYLIVFVQHEEDPASGPLVRGTRPWELVFEPRPDDPDEKLVAKSTGKY
jgi:nicotinamidase-related amidase